VRFARSPRTQHGHRPTRVYTTASRFLRFGLVRVRVVVVVVVVVVGSPRFRPPARKYYLYDRPGEKEKKHASFSFIFLVAEQFVISRARGPRNRLKVRTTTTRRRRRSADIPIVSTLSYTFTFRPQHRPARTFAKVGSGTGNPVSTGDGIRRTTTVHRRPENAF